MRVEGQCGCPVPRNCELRQRSQKDKALTPTRDQEAWGTTPGGWMPSPFPPNSGNLEEKCLQQRAESGRGGAGMKGRSRNEGAEHEHGGGADMAGAERELWAEQDGGRGGSNGVECGRQTRAELRRGGGAKEEAGAER